MSRSRAKGREFRGMIHGNMGLHGVGLGMDCLFGDSGGLMVMDMDWI